MFDFSLSSNQQASFVKNTNKKKKALDDAAKLEAISRSMAVIEFTLEGIILGANENFCTALGYDLSDIQGKHHSMFVEPAYRSSLEYSQFWEKLRRGEYESGQYKRFTKHGKEIWIEASYNPVLDQNGQTYKIVKFATDVTKKVEETLNYAGQLAAINKSQAVIEFRMDGTILTANENFCSTVGYTLQEIQGNHHSMFIDNAYKTSSEYAQFWEKLRRGEYQAAQYRRFGKGGREIWIEASYNPIMDGNGKPYKVVKYATNITAQIKLLEDVTRLVDEIEQSTQIASQQTVAGASASQQTSHNVQAVASGAEELSASVREIAESMAKSRTAAENAYERTLAADKSTQALAEAAKAMSGVVDMIQNIAGQINLLALNATIESARAGEAGKGFAVVASEVKNLSRQATDATDEISKEIQGIQTVSHDVVEALTSIKTSIDSVREFVTNTASAVEEQSAVAREMSSNMQSAAGAVNSISQNMTEISRAVEIADSAAKKTREAAKGLSR